ncbi:MAG: recombination regulator RecX [Ectobacillus sp.]
MALITKIQVQKQSNERYNVYIDKGSGEEYGFSVDEYTLAKHGLRKGMEIDELELSAILYDEEVRKAYLQAVSYLSFQMRTKQEVEEFLRKKGAGPAVVAEAVSKLVQEAYINDQEYSVAYVRTQSNVGMKGPMLIRRELRAKGIQEDDIINSLHEYPKEKQIQNAIQLCEKKKKTYKNLSSLNIRKKLEEMLMRKGYDASVVAAALEQLEDEEAPDEEWEALQHQGRKYHERYKKHDGWAYETKMKQSLYRKGFSLDSIERLLQELKENQWQ